MNKQDEAGNGSDDGQTKTAMTAQAITDIMKHPEFGPGQLPGLWQLIKGPDGTPQHLRDRWDDGIAKMLRRCDTFAQLAETATILSGLTVYAWDTSASVRTRTKTLLEQATHEQLLQALAFQQQHPKNWWRASDQIMRWSTVEQLTGPVIEQLPWDAMCHDYATNPGHRAGYESAIESKMKQQTYRVVKHVEQQLGEGNWTVFAGIVEPGIIIGHAIALATTIEQNKRSDRDNA